MKPKAMIIGLAIISFAALSSLSVVILKSMTTRSRLESRNSAERTINALFAGLRDRDDFGAAIESSENLKQKVLGVGVYARDGERLHSWGLAPASYPSPERIESEEADSVRLYIENAQNDSLVLLLRPWRLQPPPPPHPFQPADQNRKDGSSVETGDMERDMKNAKPSFLFETLRKADIVYLEIKEPEFWRGERLRALLLPLIELGLALLVFAIAKLAIRNDEYRNKIEEQRNLVILGTAASTLAHEIKNPLLSIRLQTSLLSRTAPDSCHREIGIINDEVERLSMLSYRVNDYLRDPRGVPHPIDAVEIAREVSLRLLNCDVTICTPDNSSLSLVFIDPERLRSMIENLLRNATECGGPEDGIEIVIAGSDAHVAIKVLDRGPGIPDADRGRVFDPFFTTKSRGTGIGLAICSRFALAANGSICIAPRPEGGTEAAIVLPALPAAAGFSHEDNA